MAVITTPVKTWGAEALLVADMGTYITANLQALIDGRVFKIADSVLGAATASVTFSSIPGTYRHLELHWQARADNAVSTQDLKLRLNGDVGANYYSQVIGANNTTVTGVGTAATTSMRVGQVTGALATGGFAGAGVIWIPNYAGAVFLKNVVAVNGAAVGTAITNQQEEMNGGTYQNTTVLSSVTLFPAAGNFIAGSTFSLYGAM